MTMAHSSFCWVLMSVQMAKETNPSPEYPVAHWTGQEVTKVNNGNYILGNQH